MGRPVAFARIDNPGANMLATRPLPVAITGVGIVSAIGQGREAFTRALLAGDAAFDVLQRPGRQGQSRFLGAELGPLQLPPERSPRLFRQLSLTAEAALVALHEAWQDARLEDVDPQRIGLVVGGCNLQQRELAQLHERYTGREAFVRPGHGVEFMDSDLCGLCTQQFGIQGMACTVGGASASGQVAVIQALQAVQSGQVDVAIALGALMDLSHWECQALRSLGAMGSERYADAPMQAARPFDRDRDGFIYGECCGAVVVERMADPTRSTVRPYAQLSGWGWTMDANRNPDPSREGEMRAIAQALERAGLAPGQIDYVNPHGTGSPLGDVVELAALRDSGLGHVCLNTSKSLLGHGLTAAGTVEVIATLVQMREGYLHPSRNLDTPIDPSFGWIRDVARPHPIEHALTLSMGFGGINTALCLTRHER